MAIYSYHGYKCDCCPPYKENEIVRKGERIIDTKWNDLSPRVSIDSLLSKGEFVISNKVFDDIKLGIKR